MAVTKSWELRVVTTLDRPTEPPPERRRELPWLIGASAMVLAGLLMTGFAKMQNFADVEARLERGELLNPQRGTRAGASASVPERIAEPGRAPGRGENNSCRHRAIENTSERRRVGQDPCDPAGLFEVEAAAGCAHSA